jgi:ATP-dependent DNA helicase RecG
VFHFADVQVEAGKSVGGTTQETAQETTQEKILALLKAQPSITRKELASKVGLSPDGIKYHLEKMKSAEIIRHVGSTKAGHWEVLK